MTTTSAAQVFAQLMREILSGTLRPREQLSEREVVQRARASPVERRRARAAGQRARDENGKTVGVGDIRAQTEQVIKNMQTILRAEGAELSNLVKLLVFVTDMRNFEAISEVRKRYFTGDLPTSTIVEVNHLSQPDLLIEIEGVAVL